MADQTVAARAKARYETYTGRSSDIVRTLALAGIGISWLFGGGLTPHADNAKPLDIMDGLRDATSLYVAALAAVLALALDLGQYAVSAVRWGLLHWAHDQVLLNDRAVEIRLRGRAGWAILRVYGYVERFCKDRRTRDFFADVSNAPWNVKRRAFRATLREGADSTRRVAAHEVLTTWQPASVARPAIWLWSMKVLAVGTTYGALLVYLIMAM